MNMDEILEMLEKIETEINEFYRRKKVLESTLNMFVEEIGFIKKYLEDSTDDLYGREMIIKSISKKLIILEDLFNAVKCSATDDSELLVREMLGILAEGYSIDFFSHVSSSPLISLENIFFRGRNELTFVLLLPTPHYLNSDRIGLIAHEISHVHRIVEKYCCSLFSDKRKIGESLADVLGLYMSGPLLTFSLSSLLINDFEKATIFKILPEHPSWISRITILKYANTGLWKTSIIEETVSETLAKILNIGSIPPQENLLVTKCLRENDRNSKEFSKFKIDEKRIENLKNVDSDSVLYKLIANCMRWRHESH